jgi:hypothetical protein
MDNTSTPSFEIPKSSEHLERSEFNPDKDPSLSVEASREVLPAPSFGTNDPAALTNIPSDQQTAQPVVTSGQPTTATPVVVADDVDVMEKEWVERAKKVIAMTSHDPYTESKEIAKLKASYMKQRFKKDIPLAEGGK